MRSVPKALAVAAVSLVLLTGCGSSTPGGRATSSPAGMANAAQNGAHKPLNKAEDLKALERITVTGDDPHKTPVVKFTATPVTVSATAVRVVKEGTGEESTPTSRVTMKTALFLGKNGKQLDSGYEKGGPESFVLSSTETIPGLRTALVGVRAGSRILFAIPPAEAFGAAGRPAVGFGPGDNLVAVADVVSVGTPVSSAEGTDVPPVPGLPSVTFDPKSGPAITVPKADPPTALVSQLLVEGSGAPVKNGQTLTVHYAGVVWADGTRFDSSWDRAAPFSFTLGQQAVIPGWDKGFVDKKVGSRVLLVVPPADAYRDQARDKIPANSTLVFVVDILDAG